MLQRNPMTPEVAPSREGYLFPWSYDAGWPNARTRRTCPCERKLLTCIGVSATCPPPLQVKSDAQLQAVCARYDAPKTEETSSEKKRRLGLPLVSKTEPRTNWIWPGIYETVIEAGTCTTFFPLAWIGFGELLTSLGWQTMLQFARGRGRGSHSHFEDERLGRRPAKVAGEGSRLDRTPHRPRVCPVHTIHASGPSHCILRQSQILTRKLRCQRYETSCAGWLHHLSEKTVETWDASAARRPARNCCDSSRWKIGDCWQS